MNNLAKYSIEAFLDNPYYCKYRDYLKWNKSDKICQLKKQAIEDFEDLARGRNKFQPPTILATMPVYTKYGIRYEFVIDVEADEIKINSEKIIHHNLQYIQNKLPKYYSTLTKRILSEYICFLCKPVLDAPVYRKAYGWVRYHNKQVEYCRHDDSTKKSVTVFLHKDSKNTTKHMNAFLNYIGTAPISVKKLFSFALTSVDYKFSEMIPVESPDANFQRPALCLYGKGVTATGKEITKAEVASLFLDFTKNCTKTKGSITSHAPHFTLNSLNQKKHKLSMYGNMPIITRSTGGRVTSSSTALTNLLKLQQDGYMLGSIVVINEQPIHLDQFININISDIHDISAIEPACVETVLAEYVRYLTLVLQEDAVLKKTFKLRYGEDYISWNYHHNVIEQVFYATSNSFKDEKYDGNTKHKFIDLIVSLERFSFFVELLCPNMLDLYSEIKDELTALYRDEALYREDPVSAKPTGASSPPASISDTDCKRILNDVISRYKKKYGEDFPVDKKHHRFILRNEFRSLFNAAYPHIKFETFVHQCLKLGVFKSNNKQLYFDRVVNGEKKQALVFDKFEF